MSETSIAILPSECSYTLYATSRSRFCITTQRLAPALITRIVTGDEAWVNWWASWCVSRVRKKPLTLKCMAVGRPKGKKKHVNCKTKRQLMEWEHTHSPQEIEEMSANAYQPCVFGYEIMATVFLDAQGVILVDLPECGQTVNPERYC
ncbi:hypothetical protein J6590_057981 [Homalodisca vitripennis]|nr:hypothetical protein J6590_057981 [Homalodisca vitripennis]